MKKIITLLIISSLSYFSFGQHPTNLALSSITSNSVDLSWDATVCSGNIHLHYRESGTATWDQILNINSNTYSLIGLTPNTMYDWSVKCAGTVGWQTTETFTTLCNLSTTTIADNSTCDGSYDGSASIVAFNGTPPYSYLWGNNDTTSSINSITNNTYIVNTSDSLGCSIADTILVEFDNLISLSQSVSAFTDTSRPEFPNTLQSYHVWAYDTLRLLNNGCDINIRPEFIISHSNQDIQQGHIELRYYLPGVGYMNIPYNIDSNGDAVGFWNTASSDSTGINAVMGSLNEMILRVKFQNQASYGKYTSIWSTKEVDDLGNIIQILAANDTSILTLVDCDTFQSFISKSNVSCWGNTSGSSSIDSIINGSGNYAYNWVNDNNQTFTLSTIDSISNLSEGNYSCTILDNDWGCSIGEGVTISEPSELITSLNTIDLICFDFCNGEIYSNTSGGVSPYYYSWSNTDTTANISNLCTGYQTLTITDENGCVNNTSAIINTPNPISVSIDSTSNISNYGANNGFIHITTNGGSGLLNTNWTSTNSYSSTTNDILNLFADIYYLEITDTNLCTYLDTVELSQPSSLWISINTITSPSCYDSCNGAININAYGGDSTYSYLWTGPNGFTSNNDNINNLCNGEYIIIIDDGITNLIDTVNIYQPQPITTLLSVDSIICHNGTAQAEINVWGGSQPFTYSWSNGDTNYYTIVSSGNNSIDVSDINGCSYSQSYSLSNPDSIFTQTSILNTSCFGGNNGSISINISNGGISPYNFSNDNGLSYQISNTYTNLLAGNYSFLISDINGCLGSASAEVIEPSAITSTTTAIDASCYGYCNGSVAATALGGTIPYSYIWTNGASNLCAGFYNVIISDINGCISSNSAIVNEPNPLIINISINGSNIIATSGFTSYQWYDSNNNPINGATDSIFTPPGMAFYYVTATDSNGCSVVSYSIEYTISTIEDFVSNINIFPNPTSGNITVISEYGIKTIKLYNTIGNELYSVNNKGNMITESKLDLSTFAKGVYFIKININNHIINQRIILQ